MMSRLRAAAAAMAAVAPPVRLRGRPRLRPRGRGDAVALLRGGADEAHALHGAEHAQRQRRAHGPHGVGHAPGAVRPGGDVLLPRRARTERRALRHDRPGGGRLHRLPRARDLRRDRAGGRRAAGSRGRGDARDPGLWLGAQGAVRARHLAHPVAAAGVREHSGDVVAQQAVGRLREAAGRDLPGDLRRRRRQEPRRPLRGGRTTYRGENPFAE